MKILSTGKQDYYSILQVGYDASLDEVRAAYKRLAFLTHPDRSRHPQANQHMQAINEAYAVLSNPKKRARYDHERLASTALVPVAQPASDADATQPVRKDRKDLVRKQRELIRNQLKVIFYLIIVTIATFLWFLASGEVNILMILLIVMLAVLSLASMIMRVRNLDG